MARSASRAAWPPPLHGLDPQADCGVQGNIIGLRRKQHVNRAAVIAGYEHLHPGTAGFRGCAKVRLPRFFR